MTVHVEFCGEISTVTAGETFTIGREADLSIDDNPFLHRQFLQLAQQGPFWFVTNIGTQLTATIADREGQMEAFLAPGASLPLVFERTVVSFGAGPTAYQLSITVEDATFQPPATRPNERGDTTVAPMRLTAEQRLLILSLAEPRLRGDGHASVTMPSSAASAARLGWSMSKFNRKLDYLCSKLSDAGVRGVYGGPADMASNRRSRLVEYAVATRLVTRADLGILEAAVRAAQSPDDSAGASSDGTQR